MKGGRLRGRWGGAPRGARPAAGELAFAMVCGHHGLVLLALILGTNSAVVELDNRCRQHPQMMTTHFSRCSTFVAFVREAPLVAVEFYSSGCIRSSDAPIAVFTVSVAGARPTLTTSRKRGAKHLRCWKKRRSMPRTSDKLLRSAFMLPRRKVPVQLARVNATNATEIVDKLQVKPHLSTITNLSGIHTPKMQP